MQAIDDVRGVELMKSCLGWLTFWTGVPLHYAGDEQAFKTYGTALDGWAREELSLSLAWRAIGTLPMRDAFDMAAPMYVYIQRLNRLRDAYLAPVIDCEAPLRGHVPTGSEVFAWERGCDGGGGAAIWRTLIAVNFDRFGAAFDVELQTSWAEGTAVVDALAAVDYTVGTGGKLRLTLGAHAVAVLVHGGIARRLPPVVVGVTPAHDALVSAAEAAAGLRVRLAFDAAVDASEVEAVLLDGSSILDGGWCDADGGCTELAASAAPLAAGLHHLEVRFADRGPGRIGGVFRSRFRVAPPTADDVVAQPDAPQRRSRLLRPAHAQPPGGGRDALARAPR